MWVWVLASRGWRWLRGWWKKWWRWIVFPVGLGGLVFTGKRVLDTLPDGPMMPSLPPEDQTVPDVHNALAERERKLEELKQQYKDQLLWLNEEQHRELEELEDKSTEEVVAWFDKLSSS